MSEAEVCLIHGTPLHYEFGCNSWLCYQCERDAPVPVEPPPSKPEPLGGMADCGHGYMPGSEFCPQCNPEPATPEVLRTDEERRAYYRRAEPAAPAEPPRVNVLQDLMWPDDTRVNTLGWCLNDRTIEGYRRGLSHAQAELAELKEKLAKAEADERRRDIELGQFRKALEANNLHGHYTLFQKYFAESADEGDRSRAEHDREVRLKALHDAMWELEVSGEPQAIAAIRALSKEGEAV